ncbi:hypothetical protein [Xenorhabdus griffiniae]|uniref:Phage protein n=1 Tax=Xenorhabdus griffiniae TaxID=351672 RepID=A0ABY9XFF0_9GAMM|nr:hypothetical protein [Xenorhabdus griffiniae]MBD1229393.1 hypothetical protein [Xenorhabdus griffiniae]MBE8589131.1 hypothetical protein [Xenorhabdus griffiniae]WMV71653.1 hypothetical protein QL128_16145 [Xenorhabdus griffiniae]WNH01330.1 hypothetical protein QL112_016150 [Xenorhabdus griffiniae]
MFYHPFSDDMVRAINEGAHIVLAARLDLVSGVVCAHTGVGNLVIAGENYLGVGNLGEIEAVSENMTTSPTQLVLKLTGFDRGLVGTVLNERGRGRDARVMMVTIGDDGRPILAEVLFAGQISTINVVAGNENAVSVTISNRFERWSMGLPDRFTDESWSARRQGDRIFRYVAQMAERAIYWGSKKDAPAFVYK